MRYLFRVMNVDLFDPVRNRYGVCGRVHLDLDTAFAFAVIQVDVAFGCELAHSSWTVITDRLRSTRWANRVVSPTRKPTLGGFFHPMMNFQSMSVGGWTSQAPSRSSCDV